MMRPAAFFHAVPKVLLTLLLTVSIQAQQADALKMTITEGPPIATANKNKKEAAKVGPLPSSIMVEVRDDTGRIVPGARVQINTPVSAGKPILGWTDTEGRAYIDGVIPVGQEGKLPITAEARFNGKLGTATFNNTAMQPAPPEIMRAFTFKKQDHKVRNTLIVAGIVGSVALAIALAIVLPGGAAKMVTPAGPTATTVSLGGVSVGAPQ